MSQLKIGIVANKMYAPDSIEPYAYRAYVNQEYVEAVECTGATPVMLPVVRRVESIREQIQMVDAVVLSGGYDLDPTLYGETPSFALGKVVPEVDAYYMTCIREALLANKPIFGICKGLQAINVAFGGSLYQDLASEHKGFHQHTQTYPRFAPFHEISCQPGSFVYEQLGESCWVNSHHHQAVKDLGEGLRITAQATDGVVEAIEAIDKDMCVVGVQWHPEMMAVAQDQQMTQLLAGFFQLVADRQNR